MDTVPAQGKQAERFSGFHCHETVQGTVQGVRVCAEIRLRIHILNRPAPEYQTWMECSAEFKASFA